MTASHFKTDFTDQINGLYGYLEMTASHFKTDFTDQINGLYGYLEMTASHFETEFVDQKNQLYGYMEMTASGWETRFTDQKNQLYGYVEATASHWESLLVDESASIRSLVRQTASSWESRVEGVVDKDGNVTAASIGVAINDDKSNAFINADHIHLTGSTLLSGHLTVEDGNLKVLTALSVGNTTGKIVTINAGKVNIPDTLQISSGAELLFVGSQTGERYSFSASNVGNILTDAAINNSVLAFSRKNGSTAVSIGVSGNSLVFTDSNGHSLSFSKATTLEKAWDGGKLTVDAYQTNNGTKTRVGQFISTHELSLNGQGSSNFSVEMKTHDTGDSSGVLTVRDSKYIYLYENVNGASSTVVAGENSDGTSSVASISTRRTFNAGKIEGNAEGQAEYKTVVRSRFKSSSGGYYIEGYESTTGNSISGSDTTYKLGTSGTKGSTKVQIQDASGTKISETAELPVGNLYTDGKTDGHGEMGIEADAQNSLVKAVQGSTKSLPITIPNPTFRYDESTNEYRVTMTAKAGNTTVVTATSTNTSGKKAYNDGWDGCVATQKWVGKASKTLEYGEQVNVAATIQDKDKKIVSIGAATYVAPPNNWDNGANTSWPLSVDANHGNFVSSFTPGTYIAPGRRLYGESEATALNYRWYVPTAWLASATTEPAGTTKKGELDYDTIYYVRYQKPNRDWDNMWEGGFWKTKPDRWQDGYDQGKIDGAASVSYPHDAWLECSDKVKTYSGSSIYNYTFTCKGASSSLASKGDKIHMHWK